jgi:hypothetical protein
MRDYAKLITTFEQHDTMLLAQRGGRRFVLIPAPEGFCLYEQVEFEEPRPGSPPDNSAPNSAPPEHRLTRSKVRRDLRELGLIARGDQLTRVR